MTATSDQLLELPTGSRPGWELNKKGAQLQNVFDSGVVAESLKRSREKWLTMFPVFSTKTRSGSIEYAEQPARSVSLLPRGACDLEIGPHMFPATKFFQVDYLPETHGPSSLAAFYEKSLSSTVVDNQESSITTIDEDLLERMNIEAASNPHLTNALQRVAAGTASASERQALGMFIRSLSVSKTAAFDVVIEFGERSHQRMLLPKGLVLLDRETSLEGIPDVLLTTCVPFEPQKGDNMVTLRFKKAPIPLWEMLNRWTAHDEEENANAFQTFCSKQKKSKRKYLAHRLPNGPLAAQIRKVNNMKLLEPDARSRKTHTKRTETNKPVRSLEPPTDTWRKSTSVISFSDPSSSYLPPPVSRTTAPMSAPASLSTAPSQPTTVSSSTRSPFCASCGSSSGFLAGYCRSCAAGRYLNAHTAHTFPTPLPSTPASSYCSSMQNPHPGPSVQRQPLEQPGSSHQVPRFFTMIPYIPPQNHAHQ